VLRRRVGRDGAREVAACRSLPDALHLLVSGPYQRDVRVGQTLAEAEHAVGATLLWHLRVLAGWQPRVGAEQVRLLAGGFEVANVAELTRALAGAAAGPSYRLGTLAAAWSRLSASASLGELRSALAASPWGDPGSELPWAMLAGMQLSWAGRVAAGVPQASAWAVGAAALLVARERFVLVRTLPEPLTRRATVLLGVDVDQCATLGQLTRQLHNEARWALSGVDDPVDLWQAEARWWTRVERDATTLLHRPGFGPDPVVGAVALLAVDARRVRAALQIAARGGQPVEAFDAIA
jgi:hypothetical protein